MPQQTVKKVTYRQLINFFTPLAVLPVMISLTHTVINSALARMPLPELSIAIFTVVKSIVSIINSPTMMSRHLIVSMVNDKSNYKVARKFLWVMTFILSLVLLLLGITPVGEWIFKNIIGLESSEISLASSALLILVFLPLTVTLRNTYQGIVTALKRTEINLPGVIIRLLAICIFLWWVVKSNILSGVIAGSLAWVVGIALEGIFIYCYIFYKYGSIEGAIEKLPVRSYSKLTTYKIYKFFLPLALMIILTMLVRPIIQSGIARTQFPVTSLAAYGVASCIVLLVAGPLRMINQMVMIYTDKVGGVNWFKLKKFSLILGIILTIILVILALTPAGYFILHKIIAVSDKIAKSSQEAILAFSLFPLIRSLRETYWGVLMIQRTTAMIAIAKVANIIIVSFTIILGIVYINLNPAVLGALSFTLGEGIETLLICRYTVKSS